MGRSRSYERPEAPRQGSKIRAVYDRLLKGERIPVLDIGDNDSKRYSMVRNLWDIFELDIVVSPGNWWQERSAYEKAIAAAGRQLGQCCKRSVLCRTCPFSFQEAA